MHYLDEEREGKRPLARKWCKLANVKINLKERGDEGVEWIDLSHDAGGCGFSWLSKEEWESLEQLSD